MYEHPPSDEELRRQGLIDLLRSDFTRDEIDPKDRESRGSSGTVGEGLREPHSAVEVQIRLTQNQVDQNEQARLASEENIELGRIAAALLEPAPVTHSFKSYIASEVRLAHARRTSISASVSPERLGLVAGAELFDPAQASKIERKALRYYVFATIRQHVLIPVDDAGHEHSPVVPDPQGYGEARAACERWMDEYAERFGEAAFHEAEQTGDVILQRVAERVRLGDKTTADLPSLREVLELERQAGIRQRRSRVQDLIARLFGKSD
jgi:hypothetical protein